MWEIKKNKKKKFRPTDPNFCPPLRQTNIFLGLTSLYLTLPYLTLPYLTLPEGDLSCLQVPCRHPWAGLPYTLPYLQVPAGAGALQIPAGTCTCTCRHLLSLACRCPAGTPGQAPYLTLPAGALSLACRCPAGTPGQAPYLTLPYQVACRCRCVQAYLQSPAPAGMP